MKYSVTKKLYKGINSVHGEVYGEPGQRCKYKLVDGVLHSFSPKNTRLTRVGFMYTLHDGWDQQAWDIANKIGKAK